MFQPGKVTKEWLRIRRDWVRLNPPNHEGAYLCALCARPVHYTAFELDHIIPRTAENLSDWDNLQPTHRWCNQQKGSRRIEPLVSKAEYELRKLLDL